jgi:hypothetical protein
MFRVGSSWDLSLRVFREAVSILQTACAGSHFFVAK